MAEVQSYKSHSRYVPMFHFVLTALVVLNFFRTILELRHLSLDTIYAFLRGVAFLIMVWYIRAFPVALQDRIIRLEMKLRVQQLAPELAPRFEQLTQPQVVALRFAGDDELAGLTRDVLDGRVSKPDEIKRRIQHWKPDLLRV